MLFLSIQDLDSTHGVSSCGSHAGPEHSANYRLSLSITVLHLTPQTSFFFFGNVFARLHLVYLSVYVCAHCFWGTYCSLPTEHERVRESEFWFVTDLLRVGLLDLAAGEMRIRKSLMEKTLWGKKRSVAWKQQFLYLGLVILSLCLCDSELFDLKFNLCTYVVFVCFCAFWRRREPSRGRPSSAPSPAKGIWT